MMVEFIEQDSGNQLTVSASEFLKADKNQEEYASLAMATDAYSAAVMKDICRKAGVPYQSYANRSDIAGGSTLGNILMAQVSMNTVDIGLPQLAMHSACETAGAKDVAYLIQALDRFYGSDNR